MNNIITFLCTCYIKHINLVNANIFSTPRCSYSCYLKKYLFKTHWTFKDSVSELPLPLRGPSSVQREEESAPDPFAGVDAVSKSGQKRAQYSRLNWLCFPSCAPPSVLSRVLCACLSPLQTAGSLLNHKVSPRDGKQALRVTGPRAAAAASRPGSACFVSRTLSRGAIGGIPAPSLLRPHTAQGEPPPLNCPEAGGKRWGLPIG